MKNLIPIKEFKQGLWFNRTGLNMSMVAGCDFAVRSTTDEDIETLVIVNSSTGEFIMKADAFRDRNKTDIDRDVMMYRTYYTLGQKSICVDLRDEMKQFNEELKRYTRHGVTE